jgi:repressor LexA
MRNKAIYNKTLYNKAIYNETDFGLTDCQKRIVEAIYSFYGKNGYSPTVREIGALVGLKSSSSVTHQLDRLEKKGWITRKSASSRSIRLTDKIAVLQGKYGYNNEQQNRQLSDTFTIPLVGNIAAGNPILAEQQIEDTYTISQKLVGHGDFFMLLVKGDSMIGASICDGDFVVVRKQNTANNGDIVVALVDDEATVKVFKKADGKVWLIPQNEYYEPIDGTHSKIMGKVTAVIRKI